MHSRAHYASIRQYQMCDFDDVAGAPDRNRTDTFRLKGGDPDHLMTGAWALAVLEHGAGAGEVAPRQGVVLRGVELRGELGKPVGVGCGSTRELRERSSPE